MADWIFFGPGVGLAGLGAAGLLCGYVLTHPGGNPAMAALAADLSRGVRAFLTSAARALAPAVAVLFALLFWQLSPSVALFFALGAATCALASWFATEAAGVAKARTVQAARESGRARALSVAFAGAAAGGLALAALAVLGLGAASTFAPDAAQNLSGFALGSACVAFVARLAGGVHAKASQLGAELVARAEGRPGERGLSTPQGMVRSVGEAAGDEAGAGADLFASCACAVAAASILGAAGAGAPGGRGAALSAFPLFVFGAGLGAALLGALSMAAWRGLTPVRALRTAALTPLPLALAGTWTAAALLRVPFGASASATLGLAAGTAASIAAGHYASRKSTARIAEASQLGPAATLVAGLAAGLEGCTVPAGVIAAALFGAGHLAGTYGLGLCAAGMVSAAAPAMALSAYGPIVRQARRIGEAAGLGGEVHEVTRHLEAASGATGALFKGFATTAATLAALALLAAYGSAAGLAGINLARPGTLIGLLLGALVPFLFCAMTINAVGDAAMELVSVVRRCHRQPPDPDGGTESDGVLACASAGAVEALRRATAPSLTALGVPLAIGFGLGAEALGGALVGAVATASLLAFFLADSGDAWEGGRKAIEGGALGGSGTEAHRASVVGDTVGEPLKDAAAPALNVLVTFMAAVSLVIAPILPRL